MKICIPTNHNYYEEEPLVKNKLKEAFGTQTHKQFEKLEKDLFSSIYEFTTKKSTLKQVQIFGFKNERNKLEDEEQLILKLYAKENLKGEKKYIVQTGLYAGVLYHKNFQFNIITPYGDVFLKRMLNFVNDIYIDNQQVKADKTGETNEFQNIIAYLFIQSLEKAAILGLPKVYKELTQRSYKVRGKIDINAYLKNDFPFTGKLTTKFREQVYVQEIVDVLYLACKLLEKKFGKDIHQKILGVFQLLKQYYSGSFPLSTTIEKAKNHSILLNPMYATFKNTLSYAEIILKEENLLMSDSNNTLSTNGYLFDISQLFEVYLEKLLNRHFKDWYVTGQEELTVYRDMFYGRKMFPDLVLKHKKTNKIIVFDAKFKAMRMRKSDVDRSDFYQIHSYIQYYQPNILLGGLIYPLSNKFDTTEELSKFLDIKAYANGLFGDLSKQSKFIVDGINVSKEMTIVDIMENEGLFLERIEKRISSFSE